MLNPHAKLVLAASGLFAIFSALAATYTFNPRTVAAKAQGEERKLENLIPKHVPLAVKIRKEKEKQFKDLENENWARDFELQVTNIGDKPIYEFYLLLVLDVKDASGQNVIAPVYYGRTELGDFRVLATREDVSLRPGDSCFLKIHPGQIGAWDIRRREGRQHPRNISIKLEGLSFGDGTGLQGNEGIAVPRKPGTQSNMKLCVPNQIRGGPAISDWRAANQASVAPKNPSTNLPARFLPVNFLLGGSSSPASSNSESDPDVPPYGQASARVASRNQLRKK